MSIATYCPYSKLRENCKYEIYDGQPKYDKCSTCNWYKYKYHGLTTKEKIDRVQKENNVIVLLLDKSSLIFDKIMECIDTVK